MPGLMIVDDEPEITAMLKRYFVREGYETVTALTGAEALRKLRCAPDMVLLDVNLPDMDGFAVCRALREHLDCPVLFLTARVEDADKLSGFASGGHESPNSYGGRHQVQSTGFGSGYGRSRSAGNTAPAGAGTSTLAGAPSAAPQKKAAAASYAAGDIVEHRVFGRGKVLKATPIAGDCIVEIQFDRVGVKKTMANYAPLKKVEE